jgi:hypothetical protein
VPDQYWQPYYVREQQGWAIEQERMRHIQALYQVGENAAFFLMWHLLDFEAGLVGRCTRCYAAGRAQRVAEVYNQPTQQKCPDCYGTTFQGGIRARIVRPALFTDADETEHPESRGTQHPVSLTVESSVDFRLREGDYVIRADGTRWRTATPVRTNLRSGFGHPVQGADAISYNASSARLEDRTSVAYQLPVGSLAAVLGRQHQQPDAFGDYEILNGLLLPPGLVS